MKKPPIIIVGMHRSGTTMISKILEQLGIFMGKYKDINSEALFFQKFNELIFIQFNASWDNPYNFQFKDPAFHDFLVEAATKYLKSIRRIQFLGISAGLKYKDLRQLDFLWGWKDPRNVFTLDLWFDIFENAKVIHVYRNPIDIMSSLQRRTRMTRDNFQWNFKHNLKLLLCTGRLGFYDSVRILNNAECISLWKEYISQVLKNERELGTDFYHIKYEDFLASPKEEIEKLAKFVNIKANDSLISDLANKVNPKRRYAFLSDDKLIDIYTQFKDDELFKRFGYDNLA